MYKIINEQLKKSKDRFLDGTLNAVEAAEMLARHEIGMKLLYDLLNDVKHTPKEVEQIIDRKVRQAVQDVLLDPEYVEDDLQNYRDCIFPNAQKAINELCDMLKINITII